jgi:hypothetical protein
MVHIVHPSEKNDRIPYLDPTACRLDEILHEIAGHRNFEYYGKHLLLNSIAGHFYYNCAGVPG